jgi:hypothetical protein
MFNLPGVYPAMFNLPGVYLWQYGQLCECMSQHRVGNQSWLYLTQTENQCPLQHQILCPSYASCNKIKKYEADKLLLLPLCELKKAEFMRAIMNATAEKLFILISDGER